MGLARENRRILFITKDGRMDGWMDGWCASPPSDQDDVLTYFAGRPTPQPAAARSPEADPGIGSNPADPRVRYTFLQTAVIGARLLDWPDRPL